ncbi:MAG: hypothetical protein V3U11_07505, partial [Planctomycetota bacterium]
MLHRLGILLMAWSVLGCASPDETYRRAALDTGRWLQACAIQDGDSCHWPVDPTYPKSITTN